MDSFYLWTIGCQMNKADSERLESALGQLGLRSAPEPKSADVIVLNSCVVRQSAEDKVVGMLTSLKPLKTRRPDRVVALMGCMVGPRTDALEKRFPYVDVFMRPQEYAPLVNLLGERMGVDPEGCLSQLSARPAVAAYIPIIHGCDKFCSFCIIPYRRGREKSRTIPDVTRECELLAARGVKEVTLLGQNVDSYGQDLAGDVDLADLLAAVNDVDELRRVRFLTSHPNDMSNRIIDAVADLDKVCEHVNLPFQAGGDLVLETMRRGYDNAQYRRIIDRIRERIAGVSLATDLIVGFCGESEDDFQQTVDMISDIRFDKVHSAAYSVREGTIAARKMEDDVDPDEKKRRLQTIDRLQEEILTEINAKLAGSTQEVLVEGRRRGRLYGRNRNDKLVYFEGGDELVGNMVDIEIEATSPWALRGRMAAVAQAVRS